MCTDGVKQSIRQVAAVAAAAGTVGIMRLAAQQLPLIAALGVASYDCCAVPSFVTRQTDNASK